MTAWSIAATILLILALIILAPLLLVPIIVGFIGVLVWTPWGVDRG